MNTGGAQRQACDLITHLDPTRVAVTLICLGGPRELTRALTAQGYRVRCLGKAHRKSFGTLFRLIDVLRVERPTVVHTDLISANSYGRLAAWLTGIPVVIASERSVYTGKRQLAWFHRAAEQLLKPVSQMFVVNSETIAQDLATRLALPRNRICVIYNGVDETVFDASRPGVPYQIPSEFAAAPKIGIVATLTPPKNHTLLLRAAVDVLRHRPDAVFLLAGSGGDEAHLRGLCDELGIAQRVLFLGDVRDVVGLYRILDVCALSSIREGLPNVILEAMAMGKPVVATDVGGIKEVVIDSVNGYLVPIDDPQLFARRIVHLLDHPDLRQRMGSEGRALVMRKFTLSTMADRTMTLYEKLVHRKTSSQAKSALEVMDNPVQAPR